MFSGPLSLCRVVLGILSLSSFIFSWVLIFFCNEHTILSWPKTEKVTVCNRDGLECEGPIPSCSEWGRGHRVQFHPDLTCHVGHILKPSPTQILSWPERQLTSPFQWGSWDTVAEHVENRKSLAWVLWTQSLGCWWLRCSDIRSIASHWSLTPAYISSLNLSFFQTHLFFSCLVYIFMHCLCNFLNLKCPFLPLSSPIENWRTPTHPSKPRWSTASFQ